MLSTDEILLLKKGKSTVTQLADLNACMATFATNLLLVVNDESPHCQALVLVPSRELALQFAKTAKSLIAEKVTCNVKVHACAGGNSLSGDMRRIESGAHVVIGTHGRALDMLKRGIIKREHLRVIAFDEELFAVLHETEVTDIYKYAGIGV